MRRIIQSSMVLAFVIVSAMVFADGSITQTNKTLGAIRVKEIYWASLTNRTDGTTDAFNGELLRVTCQPLSTLTNNYVVSLTDSYGVIVGGGRSNDVLTGLSVISNKTVTFAPVVLSIDSGLTNTFPLAHDGKFTVAVTNTGVGNGRVVIFYREL